MFSRTGTERLPPFDARKEQSKKDRQAVDPIIAPDASLGAKLLVIDDDAIQRKLLNSYLSRAGYSVELVESGVKAKEILSRRMHEFDAILTDLMMPKVDGLTLTRYIREYHEGTHLPILLITGDERTNTLTACLDAGADDYINKPVRSAELLARLRAALRIRQMDAALRRSSEQMRKDLQAAQQLQYSLLPDRNRTLPGLDIEWRYCPSMYVAGDLLNYFQLDDERFAFYVADTVGHGAAAAMFAFWVNQLLVPELSELPLGEPGALSLKLDEIISQRGLDRFLTMIYGVYEPATGKLTYCSAGHPYPILVRRTGEIEALQVGGTPVGMGFGIPYSTQEIQMNPGDRLFMYSDGVTEAVDPDGNMYGFERFKTEIDKTMRLRLDDQLDALLRELTTYQGRSEFDDDVTLLAVKVR